MKNFRSLFAVALLSVGIVLVNVSAGATPPYDTNSSSGWRNNLLLQRKNLPQGLYDFVPLSREFSSDRFQSEVAGVLCETWRQAISYAVRYRRGMSDDLIIKDIASYWKGRHVCGQVLGRILGPTHKAIRGDRDGNRISIIKLEDERGVIYYSGFPLD
jgi:hypothetical protein